MQPKHTNTCSVLGCENPRYARTVCFKHYERVRRNFGWRPKTDLERLYEKFELRSVRKCWPWTASLSKGYGQIRWNGQTRKAYKVFYELIFGPVPDGLELDHVCRNTACVNPFHLEPVTHKENMLRSPVAACARPDACPQGHPYTDENSRFNKHGHRRCHTCYLEGLAAKRSRPDYVPKPRQHHIPRGDDAAKTERPV